MAQTIALTPFLIITLLFLFVTIFWLLVYFEVLKEREDRGIKIKRYPKIAVIIPTLHEGEDLKESILSVLRSNYPKQKLKVYIALNKSTDEKTRAVAYEMQKRSRRVVVVDTGVDGKAKVMNYVLKNSLANEEYVLTLDADSIVEKETIKRLLSMFDDEKVAVVTPSVAVHKPKNFIEKLQEYDYILSMALRKAYSEADALLVAPGPGSLFRRDSLEKVGYFDENNVTEDMEIALRLLANGYKIRNKLNAFTYTKVPTKARKLLKQRIRWYTGFFINLKKHHALLDKKQIGASKSMMLIILISTGLILTTLPLLGYSIYYGIKYSIAVFSNVSFRYVLSVSMSHPLVYFFELNEVSIFSLIALSISLYYVIYALEKFKKQLKIKDYWWIFLYITFFGYLIAFSWLYSAIKGTLFRKELKW